MNPATYELLLNKIRVSVQIQYMEYLQQVNVNTSLPKWWQILSNIAFIMQPLYKDELQKTQPNHTTLV